MIHVAIWYRSYLQRVSPSKQCAKTPPGLAIPSTMYGREYVSLFYVEKPRKVQKVGPLSFSIFLRFPNKELPILLTLPLCILGLPKAKPQFSLPTKRRKTIPLHVPDVLMVLVGDSDTTRVAHSDIVFQAKSLGFVWMGGKKLEGRKLIGKN